MSSFARYALSLSVVPALLAGCGGSQPPIGAPGAMPLRATTAVGRSDKHPVRGMLSYQVLFQFSRPYGTRPYAGLTEVHGMFYGTTRAGGTKNKGTVFSMSPGGTEKVLHSFGGRGSDGRFDRRKR
jgi:uncharacterized repeat protein (TIGR03803 family)